MSEKLNTCAKCGVPIESHPGPGRPLLYCSAACRQASAYEIKRLTRRLELRESRRLTLRHVEGIEREIRDGFGRTVEEQVVAVDAEIAEDEERLRLLLSEPHGTPLTDTELAKHE